MLFDSVVWWPSAEGLMGMIDVIAPGGVGVHGCNDGRSARPGSIEEGDSGDANASFVIRGESVRLNSRKIEPQFDIQHWTVRNSLHAGCKEDATSCCGNSEDENIHLEKKQSKARKYFWS